MRLREAAVVLVSFWATVAHAQQPPVGQQQPPMQQQMPQQAPPQIPESDQWAKMPRMTLERQYAGPLQDTIIQRWRDPTDGMICYIYLPITASHSAPTASGFAQYGANTIGSISCVSAPAPAAAPVTAAKHPLPLH
jgi:hypothetical protein